MKSILGYWRPEVCTRRLMERLSDADLFSRVGHTLRLEIPVATRQLSSWREAEESLSKAENSILDLQGDISVTLRKTAPKQRGQWNTCVREVKKRYTPTIFQQIAQALGAAKNQTEEYSGLGQTSRNVLEFIIIMSAVEAEFSRWIPAGLFTHSVELLIDGHCPCGWNSDDPNLILLYY